VRTLIENQCRHGSIGTLGRHEAKEVEACCAAAHIVETCCRDATRQTLEAAAEMTAEHDSHGQLREPVARVFEVDNQKPTAGLERAPHFGEAC
jgi:hypothetical protein